MSFSKASSQRKLKPICIIDFNDPNVNEIDALRKLLSTVEPHCKLICISIAGRRRAGKSTLLCFFIRYLEARCQTEQGAEDWMEPTSSDEELEGFPSEHTTKGVTRGILVWPKLFKIDENIAVLLMDTQGIFDDSSTLDKDAKLISLSLLLSSVQIFNIKGNLDKDCVDNLDIFTKVAGLASGDSSAHLKNSLAPFQELIILLRDWENRDEFDYGWTGGQNRLNVYRDGPSASTWTRVTACFENGIKCFLMPRPGDKTVEDGSKKLVDMKDEFKNKVKEFIENIFRPGRFIGLKFNGKDVTCGEFAGITQLCIGKVRSGGFPIVRDIVSSVANDQINRLVETLAEEHRKTISKLVDKCPFEHTSLCNHLQNELEKVLRKFNSSPKIEVAEISKKGRQRLLKAIRSQNETLELTNATAQRERVMTGAAVGGAIGGIGGIGAVVGGVAGIVAGPAGIAAGAAIGAAIGATVGGAASYASVPEIPREQD